MRFKASGLWLLASLSVTTLTCADARLPNFDLPAEQRVPGQYEVVFKTPSELQQLLALYAPAASGISKPAVLPDKLPISVEDTTAIVNSLAASIGGTVLSISHSAYGFGAQFSIRGLTDDAAKSLAKDPRIEVISPATYASPDTSQATLNDPQGQDSGDYLWHLDRIDQKTGALNRSYTYYATGVNVDAWVLDTGVFGDESGDGLTPDFHYGSLFFWDCTSGTCGVGYNSNHCNVTPAERAKDLNGHGTQVAGVLGGTVHGVAKQVTINSVKVLGDCTYTNGNGTSTNFIAGMELVLSSHQYDPSDVVNFSAHFPPTLAVDNEVKKVIAAGIPVVVAAGNESADACTFSPGELNNQAGGYPGLIVVSGSTRSDQMDPNFAYGSCVSIFAPDELVLTAGAPWGAACSTCTWRNGANYPYTAEVWSAGTSVSVPSVTGIVALYLQSHPTATAAQVKTAVLGSGSVQVLGSNTHNSPNLLANSCVPGNNPTLDPNAAGCPGGGGGGGLTRAQKGAIQAVLDTLLLSD